MLKYQTTRLFFIVLLLALVGYDVAFFVPYYVYLLLAMVYSLIIFYGSYFVHSNFFINVICEAKTSKKEIAISFDDGPAKNYSAEILSVLKETQTEAAFFCIGNRVGGNETLLREIHNNGHIIGNHSYSHHFWFDFFSVQKMKEDLQKMNESVEMATGLKPRLFRPPYGVTTPNLAKAIKDCGFLPIGWNIRSMDTVIKDEKKLFEKVSKAIRPGAIVLFHDTSQTTLAILPSFINYALKEGYKIVRLDKMLQIDAYA